MKALENREFLAFCKLLFFRSLKKQKIQAIYFEIYGLYFKISALYFLRSALCFFSTSQMRDFIRYVLSDLPPHNANTI